MSFLPDAAMARLRDVAVWPQLPEGRYTLTRQLGRGGMGTVYAAQDGLLDREVAIKVSNTPAADTDLERRLQQEARVLARLEHPGIVPVHDAGMLADGRWFYVMKLVRGETLTDHVRRLDSAAATLLVFERVAEAVAFAHAAGIVHRDLKPSNVMVGPFGEVLVLDWGVAKVLGRPGLDAESETVATRLEPTHETQAGMRIGTPGFMSPEQRAGAAAEATPAADTYALGSLMVWLLTGTTAPTEPDNLSRQLQQARFPTNRRLRAVVAKCLEPRPDDRYRDASALAADLARYRAGHAVSVYRETPLDRFARWFGTYRTFVLLVLAYLIMRTLFAFLQR